jgi:hypothetical protein
LVSQPLTRGNISHATNTTEVNTAVAAPVLTDVDYAIETIPSSNVEIGQMRKQQNQGHNHTPISEETTVSGLQQYSSTKISKDYLYVCKGRIHEASASCTILYEQGGIHDNLHIESHNDSASTC